VRPDVRYTPRMLGGMAAGAVLFLTVAGKVLQAAPPQSDQPKPDSGREIYLAACAACHGPDGRGQRQSLAGFERPPTFPDFSDCATATVEPDSQWRAIITNGGPARAFSEIMPSFKDALTQDQVGKVIAYLRTLCVEKGWPRGNFNLPRPLITEKAFPENEVVLNGAFNVHGSPGGEASVIYERRIGSSGMFEAALPYLYTHEDGVTRSGFGDIALGYKHKLADSLESGSIFSLGGEWIIPSGDPSIGTGGGSTVFEGYVSFGQILPADGFAQFQAGIELPVHTDKLPRAAFFRTAVGRTFSAGGGFGRRWSPMAEFIADRDLVAGAKTNWDIVPEIQIPINKRMHILANLGFRIPVNHTADRPRQLMLYLLWDYPDGGLRQGW